MKVYQISVGPMQNFSYIVEDESTQECIVIDPSWDLEKLTAIIDEQNLNPKYIVNTHWHDDHTRGNEELAKKLSFLLKVQITHRLACSQVHSLKHWVAYDRSQENGRKLSFIIRLLQWMMR